MTRTRMWVLAAAALGLAGCAGSPSDDAKTSNLTPGVVKMTIQKGKTTQNEILETFGPPDLVTHKDGADVWTYDKTNYDYEKRSDYLTVLLAGTGGDRVRSSSRSTMLIVYFDGHDVVSDYRLSAIKY
jgi:hypothetical protein